jgi:hypothetical protein
MRPAETLGKRTHSPPLIVISVCFIYTLNNISALGYPKTYPKNLGTTSRLSLTEGLGAHTSKDTFVLQKEQTKGNKTRIVYVSTALKKVLISYKQTLSNFTYDSYLFSTRKSKCFSANTMSQLFLNIFKSAQLDDASSHSMRRTFITELAHKGINVRVLQSPHFCCKELTL